MKKANEAINIIRDMQYLIWALENELNQMRNIAYRYYLEHGEKIKGGEIYVKDSVSFGLHIKGENIICKVKDLEGIMDSNQQKITNQIKKLNE